MKILKPGKVEQRKFVCPSCGCVFVADRTDVRYSVGTDYVVCPCCGTSRNLTWKYGEPYEELMQDDRKRLEALISETPDVTVWPDALNKIVKHLIANGVTFREG